MAQVPASSVSPTGDLELRPSVPQLRGFLTGLPLVLVVLAALLYYREGVVGLVTGTAMVAAVLGLLWVYMARSRVRLSTLALTRRGLVTTRTLARSDARDVVLTPYQASSRDPRVVLTLFVRDHAGRRVLRLTSAVWSPADLERLAHMIGPRPTIYTEVLTPALLEERHPGSTTPGERHPRRVSTVITVTTLVVLAAVFYSLS